MKDPTYIVCVEQAGFDILYAFMLADGEAEEKEMRIIHEFLHTERVRRSSLFDHEKPYHSECNFIKEFAYLKTLDKKALRRRLEKAAHALMDWLPPKEADSDYKEDLIKFAVEVIKADGVLSEDEIETLNFIGKTWKMDIQPYLNRKP